MQLHELISYNFDIIRKIEKNIKITHLSCHFDKKKTNQLNSYLIFTLYNNFIY